MSAIATATPYGIVVSGPTAESVNAQILQLSDCVGSCFASFTAPVKDAKGEYVAIGHVQLDAPAEETP